MNPKRTEWDLMDKSNLLDTNYPEEPKDIPELQKKHTVAAKKFLAKGK